MIYTETNINHTAANVKIFFRKIFGHAIGKREFANYNKKIGS